MKTEYVFPGHLVDEAIDAMLKASGSALAFYSMPSSIEIMRTTMQGIMNRALAEAPKPSAEPVAFDWPEYHEQGMGCGLEDRCITDRYEAMRHGWECAMDRVAEMLDNCGPLYAGQPPAVEAQKPCSACKGECGRTSEEFHGDRIIEVHWIDCERCEGSGLEPAVDAQEQPAPIPTSAYFTSRVADLLHLLQFAEIVCPSDGDREQAFKAMDDIRAYLTSPQNPEAE